MASYITVYSYLCLRYVACVLACICQDITSFSIPSNMLTNMLVTFDSFPLLWSLCGSKKQLFPVEDGDRVISPGVRLDEHKASLAMGGVAALVWGISGI